MFNGFRIILDQHPDNWEFIAPRKERGSIRPYTITFDYSTRNVTFSLPYKQCGEQAFVSETVSYNNKEDRVTRNASFTTEEPNYFPGADSVTYTRITSDTNGVNSIPVDRIDVRTHVTQSNRKRNSDPRDMGVRRDFLTRFYTDDDGRLIKVLYEIDKESQDLVRFGRKIVVNRDEMAFISKAMTDMSELVIDDRFDHVQYRNLASQVDERLPCISYDPYSLSRA